MSIRLGLAIHDSLFKNKHFVWSRAKDSVNFSNTINRLKIILCYSLSLNICECLICQMEQQNCNRPKNHAHFHLKILL